MIHRPITRPVTAALLAIALPFAAHAEIKPTVLPAPPAANPLPAVADATVRAATKPIRPSKIILVGDSTTQVGSGWGGAFCADHVTSFLACIDLARGGRGTFDYRAEGSWAVALGEMRVAKYVHTYVLIQFGHNDQPGKPGRSTDLTTEFGPNLRRYVEEARAAGAIPVLVTPLTRRSFRNGSLQDDLAAWAEVTKRVATEMKVPLVDLHATSVAAVQAMGPGAALDLAETPPPPEVATAAETGTTIAAPAAPRAAPMATEVSETPQGHPAVVFDYTHLGPNGAALFSRQIAFELARAVPDLRPMLVP
jgi:lysophospholipase L1-like esterase